jgi:hypothetical protein
MTQVQMTWAPEGRWSAANLLEHLSLSFLVTGKACGLVLRQERPDLPKPTWNQHWWAIRVITLGYLPMRVKAPKMVCPRGQSPEEAITSLMEHLAELDHRLQKCKEKFGTKVGLLTHPYLGPLTVSQWRKFQLFHVRRHMRQIRQLRRQMTNPQWRVGFSAAAISTLKESPPLDMAVQKGTVSPNMARQASRNSLLFKPPTSA